MSANKNIKLEDGFTSASLQLVVLNKAIEGHLNKLLGVLDRCKTAHACARYEHQINAVGDIQRAIKNLTNTNPNQS